MTHQEHVNLIRQAINHKGGIWADLGSGEGAFTLALRDLTGPDVEIYSVDKDRERIKRQKEIFNKQFPGTNIHFREASFTDHLDIPLLDGIVMANSLHYVKDHVPFLSSIKKHIKPNGKFVLVEYNIDQGNHWVPFPLSFITFEKEVKLAGFKKVDLLKKIPSKYWDEMYSAQASNT